MALLWGARAQKSPNPFCGQMTPLKQAAEAKLCLATTIDNACTHLVVAEELEADMLKECAVDLITANPGKAMKSAGWANLQTFRGDGALLAELFAHATGAAVDEEEKSKRKRSDSLGLDTDSESEDDSSRFSLADIECEEARAFKVPRLRAELHSRGLDTDGRKPQLLERLEGAIRFGERGSAAMSALRESSS